MELISRPSTRTRPWSGRRTPEITSKSVVLPAPFGPISPQTSLGWADNDTLSRARTEPKRTVTSSSSRPEMSSSNAMATQALKDLDVHVYGANTEYPVPALLYPSSSKQVGVGMTVEAGYSVGPTNPGILHV